MKTIIPLLALVGCVDGITGDARPRVSVLKQDGGCFALMAGEAIEPTLGVSGTCSYRAEPRMLAGIDLIEVIVDYGADVPFAGSTIAPRPNIVITLDGVASEDPIEISDEFRVGERAYFIATFRAPKTASNDVRVTAGVNAGFQTTVAEVLETYAPQVELLLLECQTGGNCDLPGSTGAAHIHVAVPGTITQFVTIHSTLDGIQQPDPLPPVRTFVVNNRTENTSAVPIPVAPDGTLWTISAQVGDGPLTEVDAIIRKPLIITRLTCGNICNLDDGDAVGLEIVTPANIRPLEALVTTRLAGIPQLVDTRVSLQNRADGTTFGTIGLVAPGPGAWQIDVTVAGYSASTIVTQVQ